MPDCVPSPAVRISNHRNGAFTQKLLRRIEKPRGLKQPCNEGRLRFEIGPLRQAVRAGGRVRIVPSLRVGTKKGYFGRPPMPVESDLEDVPTPDEIDQVGVWSLDDVPSDDERALIKIRRLVIA